jgi:hypothetical protein
MKDPHDTENDLTIAGSWEGYHEAVVPDAASEAQQKETRIAFYAGAHALFHIFRRLQDAPDAERNEALQHIEHECEAFIVEQSAMANLRKPPR